MPENPSTAKRTNSGGRKVWAAEKLGYQFQNEKLLQRALTHKSVAGNNYERLEFLGDRVLGLVIAAWLYQQFPDDPEGKLNARYARLVSRTTCADVARSIGVGPHLILGAQARTDGAEESDNILGDVMEALIGAIWLEDGLPTAEKVIHALWQQALRQFSQATKHPKSAVQEWAAAKGKREPVYRLLRRSGPPHLPRFHVELEVAGLAPVHAEGSSKQDAETSAARIFMETHAS